MKLLTAAWRLQAESGEEQQLGQYIFQFAFTPYIFQFAFTPFSQMVAPRAKSFMLIVKIGSRMQTKIAFGNGPGVRDFRRCKAYRPFGREMILVLASGSI